MDIPRFDKKNVNPRLVSTNIGDAFQGFVHELLLPEHPNLHRFPGGGKDGGIDLIDTSNTCFVVECKVVGEDGYAEAEKRWKTVRNNLQQHLRDPSGPTSGQSQYLPWYSIDKPIAEYVFCVSSSFSNEQQRRDLEEAIMEFFRELAGQFTHLSHLSSLKVSVVDWNDLTTRLRQRPHIVFRWFPLCRPSGLVPLDEAVDVGTFRAYLTDAKLPYYSLAEHLRVSPAPEGVSILDEESLLACFDNPEITGLVISGKGGIGKSRLTLELGWLALRKGWSVLRVQGRLKEDALEDLAERLTPELPVLLLVDYIETQSDFGELVENLNVLNDSGVARLRYVASCRTGYYHQALAASSRHLPVDLTPPRGAVALDWYSDYRSQTVARILAKAGLPISQQHLEICHDLPILAVFLAYLHTAGRNEDLAELLTEVEFGRWVAKRVQLSFESKDISRDLALLVPLFPMPDSAAEQLGHNLRAVFDRLATDGWVERVSANAPDSFDTWMTAHDVLVDQILISYLRSIPNTADAFAVELFSYAADTGALSSAIISLQRIADTPPLNAVHWVKVITDAITANASPWRNVRDLLIRTSLLSVPDQISLLRTHDDIWANAEQDVAFQNILGWFARWVAKGEYGRIPEQHKEALISWISRAVPFAEESNFVITWGLRLSPELVQEAALRWIGTRPTHFQSHYLMVAWLELGLPKESITEFVHLWCRKFPQRFHLSFVVGAWLEADGDPALVQDAIIEWLVDRKTQTDARHVYKAWLDAGGDPALVQDAIIEWLVDHKTERDARHVYRAWLDAGGDPALVQDAIIEWLVDNKTDAEAQFVYKAWLDADGDKALVQDAIKEWLVDHKTETDAGHVYKAWLDAGGDKAFAQESIDEWLVSHKTDAEASHVYDGWLNAGGDKALVQDALRAWLLTHREDSNADYVFRSWLEAGGDRDLVWDAATKWLAKHRTEESAVYVTKFIAKQRNLPVNTVKDVLTWCRTFPTNEDALWRLTQLGDNLFVAGVEEAAVLTAEAVLAHLLQPTSRPEGVKRGLIIWLFSYLMASSQMQFGPLGDRVDSLFVMWLRHPLSFGSERKPHSTMQRVFFLKRVSALMAARVLDLENDHEALVRFMRWLDEWDLIWKQRAAPILDELKSKYPEPELWDIVRFEE